MEECTEMQDDLCTFRRWGETGLETGNGKNEEIMGLAQAPLTLTRCTASLYFHICVSGTYVVLYFPFVVTKMAAVCTDLVY